MLKSLLVAFFFLLQLGTSFATGCGDECMVSVAKAFAGNYSQQVAPIFQGISRKVQARGLLPQLLTSQVDKLFAPSQQELYDQVYNQTLSQLVTGVLGNDNVTHALVEASKPLIAIVLNLAKSTLREAISIIEATTSRLEAEGKPSPTSYSNPSTLPESTVVGRPTALSTIPLRPNGGPKPPFRLRRRVLNSFGSDSSGQLVPRANPPPGTPVTVSTIPVAKTYEPLEAPKNVTPSTPTTTPATPTADRKCTTTLKRKIHVCIPDVLPILNSLRKRSTVLAEKLSTSTLPSLSFPKYIAGMALSSGRKIITFVQPLLTSSQSAGDLVFESEGLTASDQISLGSSEIVEGHPSTLLEDTLEISLDEMISSFETHLEDFHQTLVEGPLREYLLSLN
ncbi:hypothetical protein PGTUg99_009982 [Puccinia graminis f. sp. tritici]|uniref:Uncharacterized protein n=1 Tax=Puccinia graminis f. sp. tritici TaxID=56615 RepID=A0A5B0S3F1_PUCGR|nr:hypothetical protein PGTUg99_009982 [Puccinia graminis f. sp. tritici]